MTAKTVLSDYIQYLESIEDKRLALLGKYFDKEAHIQGPLYDIKGHQKIRSLGERLLAMGLIKIKIVSSAKISRKPEALIHWEILYRGKKKKETVGGCSSLLFNQRGLIYAQNDYWDASEALKARKGFFQILIKNFKKSAFIT